jgi:hypothetical protein
LAALLVAAGVLAGCTHTQSGEEAAAKAYAENPRYQKVETAKFSGHVTIDGQPPPKDSALWVFLNDPKQLDAISDKHPPDLRIACDDDGKFSFTTLVKGDGVPQGKYVITFVCLRMGIPHYKSGSRRFESEGPPELSMGTDELHNLYNDPEKNAKSPEFNLDLQPPGKDDYQFNLSVAGKEPGAPGPHSITKITGAGQ